MCGLCYVGVRIYNNVFGILLPFYLNTVLQISSKSASMSPSIALIPLINYVSAVAVASRLNFLYLNIGRKLTLVIGTILGIFALLGMYAINS